MSGKCCVIQPTSEKYDERYAEIIYPVLRDRNFAVVRVEREQLSPSGTFIEAVEKQINSCDLCLVELTEDDPLIWYSYGYVFAVGKKAILLCSDERATPFPFAVGHRNLLTYSVKSLHSGSVYKKKLNDVIGETLENKPTQELSDFDEFVLRFVYNQANTPNEVIPQERIISIGADVPASLRKLMTSQYLEYIFSVSADGLHTSSFRCTDKGIALILSTTESKCLGTGEVAERVGVR
jgi:nucleoside 2-deoxyribosyltransferase